MDLARDLYYLLLRCKLEHRRFNLFEDFLLHCKVMLIKAKFPSDAVVLSHEHCLIALVCFFLQRPMLAYGGAYGRCLVV